MTKAERLQEIRVQDMVFKAFDKIFDRGLREYIKTVHKENEVSNIRMLKLLTAIKGEDFTCSLLEFMKASKMKFTQIRTTREPSGVVIKETRFKGIPEVWINQRQSEYTWVTGQLFIQVKVNRWVVLRY